MFEKQIGLFCDLQLYDLVNLLFLQYEELVVVVVVVEVGVVDVTLLYFHYPFHLIKNQ